MSKLFNIFVITFLFIFTSLYFNQYTIIDPPDALPLI